MTIKLRRMIPAAILAASLALAFSLPAGRFYETWDWQTKYKGEKTLPADSGWGPDVLEGYESRFVDQGEAFDGPVRSTIIRLKGQRHSRKGYLYVHGFNDYFFQSEMGRIYADSGYNFYAVDLRRYGRSRLPWQYPFDVRDMKEYFADIDSALAQMRRDGITDITLGGHSTGGLTVCYYAACRGRRVGVSRVVTDSPFLAWNFNAFLRNVAIPVVGAIGKIIPGGKIKQDHCDGYAYSLLRQYDGEWTYNTDWKMIYSPPVKYSWIGAIESAQKDLLRRKDHITVPLLVMTSSRKIEGCDFTPEFMTGDAVLDPASIRQRGRQLGSDPMVCEIDSGLHDLILSPSPHREAAYDTIFRFMRTR
ncbi:MAG: alpha/beta fold hydrolase [Muribaculaceae bacterium]|nr:alpha/beta fold hydrolase [Muribaculaceae bacterium]